MCEFNYISLYKYLGVRASRYTCRREHLIIGQVEAFENAGGYLIEYGNMSLSTGSVGNSKFIQAMLYTWPVSQDIVEFASHYLFYKMVVKFSI